MTSRRARFVDPLVASGVGLVALALYLRTLAPGLLWGDPGEFQFAAWLAGLAHPTGYPLYLILGWLWTHALPWGDPAWRMNLFSAAWGGVAVGLVYLTALRILRHVCSENRKPEFIPAHNPALKVETFSSAVAPDTPGMDICPENRKPEFIPAHNPALTAKAVTTKVLIRSGAAAAALIFAATPTFWSQAVVAEVYTLHIVFVAAILLAAIGWADDPRPSRMYLLAGLVGLSLAHHRSTLLLLPGLLVFLWLSRPRTASLPRGRRLLIALISLLVPLFLYLYIPLRAPQTPYLVVNLAPDRQLQLYEPSLRGFFEHVSGSTFRSALGGRGEPWLAALTRRLFGEFSWAGLGLGVLGAIWLVLRGPRLLALTGLTFLAFAVFNHFYGIGDIYVFYIPVYLIWALWIAVGLWGCGEAVAWAGRRAGAKTTGWGLVLATVVGLALAGWLASRSYAANDRSLDRSARTAWEAVLAGPLPNGALLISNDRDEMVPQWYLKYVEGQRPDLDGLFPLIQPGPAWADVAAVTEQALLTGRPVYLIKPMPGLEVKFDLQPVASGSGIGGLVRVLGPAPDGAVALPSGILFGDRLRLYGYEALPGAVSAGQPLTVTLYWDVLTTPEHDYTTFVHLVNADGRVIAQSDHRPGGVYYPTSLWRSGDRLRDTHELIIPADPGPQPYTLVVGLYRLAPDLQHLGSPQAVGQLAGE